MRRYLDPAGMPSTPVFRFPLLDEASPSIPSFVNLGQFFGPVRDQGQEGSCTGFALAYKMRALRNIAGLGDVEFSPAFIYYEERLKEGDPTQDAGAYPPDGLAILQTLGCAPEKDEPYVPGQYNVPPPEKALADANRYRLGKWWAVVRGANGPEPGQARAAILPILQLLAAKVPVNLAVLVHQSFELAPGGRIPMPGPQATDPLLGGHDLEACGYKDDPSAPGGGWVFGPNSWGSGWGDNGYFWLPYDYVANPLLTPGVWAAELLQKPRFEIDIDENPDGTYRVQVGQYKTLAAAEAQAQLVARLAAAGGFQPRIVTIATLEE
jgi:hypothetical protein